MVGSLPIRLLVSVPPGNLRGPRHAAQFYAALHASLGRERVEVGWRFSAAEAQVRCTFASGRLTARFASRLLVDAYPGVRIDRSPAVAAEDAVWVTRTVRLSPEVLPLGELSLFEDRLAGELTDPVGGLLSALGSCEGAEARVVFELRRASPRRVAAGVRLLRRFPKVGDWRLAWASAPAFWRRWIAAVAPGPREATTPRKEQPPGKLGRPCFEVVVRLQASGPHGVAARRLLDRLEASLAAFVAGGETRWVGARPRDRGSLLSVDELALLWRPWTAGVKAERLATTGARDYEPPARLPDPNETGSAVLGRVKFRSRNDLASIPLDDRRRHLLVIGKTGTGKSALLLNLVTQDLAAGHGLALLDPHGDLVEEALARTPRFRTNSVVVFAPASGAATFNPLACPDPARRSLVAASVQAALAKVFELTPADAPRLLYILQNVLLALVEHPGATLLDVPKMLVDEAFRRHVLRSVSNEMVRTFWQEFASWNDRYRTEAIAPVLNKIGQLLADERLRAVFAAPKGSLDLRRAMDRGQAVFCNLSYGRLGEPAAKLLGALLVSQIQLDALARADMPESQRRDFFVYADEFQGYAGVESVEVILSQARKYRVSLTLANQLVGQMVKQSPSLAATVFGNVGSLCVLQVGHEDAVKLADELGGEVTPENLIAIPKYTAAVRLLVNGEPTRPFTIRTLPPPPIKPSHARRSTIERASRRRASGGRATARPAAKPAKRRRRARRRLGVPSRASASD